MTARKFFRWLFVGSFVCGCGPQSPFAPALCLAASRAVHHGGQHHAADEKEVGRDFLDAERKRSADTAPVPEVSRAPEGMDTTSMGREMAPAVDDRPDASSATEKPLGPLFDLTVANDSFEGQVTYVYDGDTIKVTGTGGDEDVRLLGINTPEIAHPKYGKFESDPGGEEAKAFMENLVFGKSVTIIYQREVPRDHYGRILGVVFLNQMCVNLELMMRGYAVPLLFDDNTIINKDAWLAFHTRAMKKLAANSGLAKGSPQMEAIAGYLLGAPISKEYILRPYDTIRIQSRDPKHLNMELLIPPDGNISLPVIGKINAIKTADELSAELTESSPGNEQMIVMLVRSDFQHVRQQITQVLQNELKKTAGGAGVMPSVIAEGMLWKGGYWQARSIAQLIALAAPQAEADLSNIRLTRATGQTMIINWLAYRGGDITQNVPLENDDVVSFPPKPAAPTPKIIIAGAVEKPGAYPNSSLLQLLMQVSPKPEADLGRVVHYSKRPDTAGKEFYVPKIENFSGIDNGVPFADIGLKDGDLIIILTKPPAGQVVVFGEVRQQGYYQAADLISVLSFAQMTGDASKRVKILRGDTETIEVDLGKIMTGKNRKAQIPLVDGDMVIVGKMALANLRDFFNTVNPMANTILNFKDLSDRLQNKK